MNVVFRESFEKDLKKLGGNAEILDRLRLTIERIEAAATFESIPNVKQSQGWSGYYRIRIGDDRLGLKRDGDDVVVLRVLHRRDIYRRFP